MCREAGDVARASLELGLLSSAGSNLCTTCELQVAAAQRVLAGAGGWEVVGKGGLDLGLWVQDALPQPCSQLKASACALQFAGHVCYLRQVRGRKGPGRFGKQTLITG